MIKSGSYGPLLPVHHCLRVARNSTLPALLSMEFLRHANDRGKNWVTIAHRSLKELLYPRSPHERNLHQ